MLAGGRPDRADAWTLAAAVLAGSQAVVVLIVSKTALSDDDFTPVAQLWAMWAVVAASLNFGCQQWAAVRPAGVSMLFEPSGRRLATALLAVSVGVTASAYSVRVTLFDDASPWWPLVAGLLPIGTALVGLERGELARLGEHGWLATVIAVENTLRLLATLALAALGAPAPWYGAALLLGFATAFLRRPGVRHTARVELRPLVVASTAGLSSHALLFGSPILLSLSGGSNDDVVGLFVVLAAVRAPFVLLQGLVPRIAVRFGARPDRLVASTRIIVGVGLVAASLAAVTGTVLGDPVVGSLFDVRGEIPRAVYGLLGAAACLGVTVTVVTVRLVAASHVRPLVLAWSLPLLATTVAVLTGSLAGPTALSLWIVTAHVVVVVVVVVVLTGVAGGRPPLPRAVPDSSTAAG